MPTIYLVRHGQASFGTDDYDVLSDLGRVQADVAGAELARRPLRDPVLGSGALVRQRDTAEIVGSRLGVEPSFIDERWNELDAHALVDRRLGGPGASAGLTSAAFQEYLDEELIASIESADPVWTSFADGVREALDDLAERLPRGRAALVATSAGVIAALGAHLIGGSASAVVAFNRVSVNASLTTVTASARRKSLLTFNDHSYLLGDSGLRTYR